MRGRARRARPTRGRVASPRPPHFAVTRAEGLVGRPWYRNLIYVADVDNGYATMVFPSVHEALRANDERLTSEEIADLAQRFGAATRALTAARSALGEAR